MDHPRAARGDRDAPDGLLVIIDSTGIPVLVRPYGDVQKPPSAAVGIVSAVFHAARMGDATQLRALRSAHRSIVYVLGGEILLAFAQSDRSEETKFVQLCAEQMLRVLLRALQASIGPAMSDLESTKLRVAVSRNIALIDRLVTRSASDTRLSLGLPITTATARRAQEIPPDLPAALLYVAWMDDDQIHQEMCSTTDTRFGGIDLVVVSLLAELHTQSKSPSSTVWIGRPLKFVGVRGSSWGERQNVLGLFTSEATPADIASFRAYVDGDWAKEPKAKLGECTTIRECLDPWFERGLECCIVVPLVPSAASRAVAIRVPDEADEASQRRTWAMLSQFARTSAISDAANVRRLDYKQEDEEFTFVHSKRKPFSIYALHRGHLTMSSVILLGDRIASCVLAMQL